MSSDSLTVSVILFLLFLNISDVESMRTLKRVAGRTGGSVTIPCFYDKQYKTHLKFWCKGYYWNSCTIVAYANHSEHDLVITDHPDQNMFTVELDELKDSESGWYWCAAEIGIIMDDRDYLYLAVNRDPDVSVLESRVRGEEGGSVTIQCLYRDYYKNKQKQWCRSKDGSCYSLGKTETSHNSAVQVSDDGRRSFRVQMTGLKKSDAGWYWCRAGDLEVPVHLSISGEHPGLPDDKYDGQVSSSESTTRTLIIISGTLLLLMVVGLVIWKLKRKHNAATIINGGQTDTTCPTAEEEVAYSTVSHHLKLSPVHQNDSVIYSSVKLRQ